ncbi:MAG: hypothetical protein Kow0022_11700 [Phycisphaerales bacterium]
MFEFEFAIAHDWTVGTQYKLDPDFGRSPIVYEHATLEESWWGAFGTAPTFIKNTRFHDTGMMAIEQGLSPLPIVRLLRSDRMQHIKWSVSKEGNQTVLELRPRKNLQTQRLFFESESHRLGRSQLVSPAGEVSSDVYFEEWAPLGNDYEVPITVTTVLRPGRSDEVILKASLSDLRLVDADQVLPRKHVPADATIVDEIAGVTTAADGTVLGELKQAAAPSGSTRATRKRFSFDARTLMFAGVVLLLASGVILGWRRWKGA